MLEQLLAEYVQLRVGDRVESRAQRSRLGAAFMAWLVCDALVP